MPRDPLVDVRARARAAFLGLAVGDALGATVEFMTPAEIRASLGVHREIIGGGWLRLTPGGVTDDTEMSIVLARAILASRGFAPRAAAEALAAWLRADPCDVGNTCRRGLRRYLLDGSLEGPPSAGDAGNGAAMRMVPVALATVGDGDLLDAQAVAQGHLTHHNALSDAGCRVVGRLLHSAVTAASFRQMRRIADEAVTACPAFRFEPYRGLATGYVVDTIQTVLHGFFTTASFEACLVTTVNRGGDADTTGAIVGAIAGAYYGMDAIPRRWVRQLSQAVVRDVCELADALVELSALARGARGAGDETSSK